MTANDKAIVHSEMVDVLSKVSPELIKKLRKRMSTSAR